MRSTLFSLAIGAMAATVAYHSVHTANACSCLMFSSELLYLDILQIEQIDGAEVDLAAEEARLSGDLTMDGDGEGIVDLSLEATDSSWTTLTFQMSE